MLVPLRPFLDELGLVLTQSTSPLSNELRVIDSAYYTVSAVTCTTTVLDTESGEAYSVESVGFSADKNGDKAAYKAITGARKYGISSLFALEWFSVEPEDDRFDDKRDIPQPANASVPLAKTTKLSKPPSNLFKSC